MSNKKLKSLIFDRNVLIYIHDIMYLKAHHNEFKTSNTYKGITEHDIITIFRYLRQTRYTFFSFIITLLIMKRIQFNLYVIKYGTVLITSFIFGVLFVWCREDFKKLNYLLKAKKAVRYVLKNYNYQEYLYFLDNYLSEESTKKHLGLI